MTLPVSGRRALVGVGALAVLLVTGCGSGQDGEETGTQDGAPVTVHSLEGEGYTALVRTSGADSQDAGPLTGTLVVGPGDCLALSAQDQPHLVVWPEGAATLDGQPGMTQPGHGEMRVGTDVTMEVRQVDVTELDGIPEQCRQGFAETVLVVVDE
jgi:hypothetical protein